MKETYDTDVLDRAHDSLEGVMGQIYTDLFNPALTVSALTVFRHLMRAFNGRLATTINGIDATNKRLLYRIITHFLAGGIKPEELTVITFNQDLQAEKCLYLMSTVDRWAHLATRIFNFPGLYTFAGTPPETTAPTGGGSHDLFPDADQVDGCIRLFKLHGSLNWYSTHSSTTPSTTAMFKPTRKIRITRRRTIDPRMTLSGKQRQMHTLPVIVPPISHKAAVLHHSMSDLWGLSEASLRTADHIVVFGYSCPALDFESSNQLRRSQMNRASLPIISLIDPDSSVTPRYIGLLGAKRLHYYETAHEFIRHN